MTNARYSEEQLLQLAQQFPSTASILTDSWDPEKLDTLGAAIWADLSESWSPDDTSDVPDVLVMLDTIRYLLYVYDSTQPWKSGSFDMKRVTERVWDQAHLAIYEWHRADYEQSSRS